MTGGGAGPAPAPPGRERDPAVQNRVSNIAAAGVVGAIGLFAGIYALNGLELGQLRRMGPGYFPLVLSAMLVALAIAILVAPPAGRLRFQAGEALTILAIVASAGVFCLSIERLGLAPAVALTSLVFCAADRSMPWRQKLFITAILVVITVVVFNLLLGVQVKAVQWEF